MTLPNFVGIGSMRCGSSWLHTLLDSHPQIYVPQKRIEINYFTHYYHKGQDWYESFFPSEAEASKYKVIGEVSPQYICFPECIPRLKKVPTLQKFMTSFRDPVKRTHSDYGLAIREGRYSKSFADYVQEFPDAVQTSLYAKQLRPFLDEFPRERFLCLIFEDSIHQVPKTYQKISAFFQIDPTLFPANTGREKVNSSYVPRSKTLSLLATKIRYRLRRSDLDWVITLAKRAGVESVLKTDAKDSLAPIEPDVRKRLLDVFIEDIEQLEKMLEIDLTTWKDENGTG